MRAKTEYVQEKDEQGRTTIRKVGMAPVQREGMDYEFDIVFDVDWDHRAIVSKSRMQSISDKVFRPITAEVGQVIYAWCNSGEAALEKPLPQPRPAQVPETSETALDPEGLHRLGQVRSQPRYQGYRPGPRGRRVHRVRPAATGSHESGCTELRSKTVRTG